MKICWWRSAAGYAVFVLLFVPVIGVLILERCCGVFLASCEAAMACIWDGESFMRVFRSEMDRLW